MTSPTPRHDIYRNVHKGLRVAMFDTVQRIGSTDPADAAALGATLDQADGLLLFMNAHVKHENEHVHTAIEARVPAGASATADDHHEHIDSLAALRAQVRGVRSATPGATAEALHRLYLDLAGFVAENLQHMRVEETQNNAQLWFLYSDAELTAIHDRLLASVDPAIMADAIRWMARGLSLPELVQLVTEMRDNAPAPVFEAMLDVIRQQVDDVRWTALNRALASSAEALSA